MPGLISGAVYRSFAKIGIAKIERKGCEIGGPRLNQGKRDSRAVWGRNSGREEYKNSRAGSSNPTEQKELGATHLGTDAAKPADTIAVAPGHANGASFSYS